MARLNKRWLLMASTALLAACAAQPQRTGSGLQGPENYFIRDVVPQPEVLGPDGLPLARGIAVPSKVHSPPAWGFRDTPKIDNLHYKVPEPEDDDGVTGQAQAAAHAADAVRPQLYPSPQPPPTAEQQTAAPDFTSTGFTTSFNTINFDTNATNAGVYSIPPDSNMAAGPNHVVVTSNVSMQVWNKTGTTKSVDKSLKSFFSALAPSTTTFDPKVVYDSYAQRWVLVTLEQSSPSTSNIYLAVSSSNDPTGSWYQTKIISLETVGATNYWMDYPGLAVGTNAIYLTGNLFAFGGSYYQGRLYIVPKGLGTGGFYDGGTATANRYDPYTSTGGYALTSMPAQIYGTPPSGSIGTWLVAYSGLTDGTNDYLQFIRVDSPTSTPTFTQSLVNMGNVDTGGFTGVPQVSSASTLDGGDQRDLAATYSAGSLWTTIDVVPPSGTNAGQITAHYLQLAASTSVSITGQGDIGGEDIATGAYTFYPSIAANRWGDAVIGFSSSGSTIHPGAYAVSHRGTDSSGTVSAAKTLKAGTDYYARTFGGGRNRWGDYSATAVDPVDECFWVYNQWADTRGTIVSGEDGRWNTTVGKACTCRGTESSGDSDGDGICDLEDNCPATSNHDQANADGDSLGDACDPCPSNSSGACTAPSADLSITKSDGVAALAPGASTTYNIVVTNPSANAVSSVTVADTFSANLVGCTWTCAASSGGSCPNSYGVGDISQKVVVGAGGTVTFAATCTVKSTFSGSLSNTATVSYANDPNAANNSATDTDTISGSVSDLSITNSDGVTSLAAGSNTTYTLTVTNPATFAVSSVGVTDTFPGTLSGCSWTCSASSGGSCQSASGSGNIATTTNTIAADSGTLTYAATCTLSSSATGSLANTASLTYASDSNSANNTATDTDTIVPRADLSLSNSDGVSSLNAGSNTTYAIVVTNPATVAVSNVSLSDTFPSGLSSCSWTCSASAGGSCQSASGSGNISTTTNSIAGSNGTLSFSATCTLSAAASGSLANTASVSYGNDINAANNSVTDTDTITPLADLSITTTDGAGSVNAGASVSYTITATNPATSAVSAVSVADTFPGTLSACSWTCSASAGGSCQSASGSGNIATTTNSIAANGGTVAFNATCTLSSAATGSLANTATLSYAGDTTNTANNSSTDTDTIVPRADLTLANSDGATTINAGANASYTITVTNPATVAVSGVSVSDTFPAALSSCTWSCSTSAGGTCEAANGTSNIATTANSIAGSSGTLTFNATCTLSAAATGSLANTASVGYANDNNAANNSVTDTDTVLPQADLSMANTDGVGAINAGTTASYVITITNPTANAISNVTVTDNFPASLSGCTWGCTAIGGSCGGAASGSGNISRVVTIAANNTVKFTPSCTLSASASGTLDNTATLSYPNDTNSANDSVTDTDDVVPRSDVSLTNTDGVASVNAGASTTYTITATNPAAVGVVNARIIDTFPAPLTGCTWTCTASAGGNCANPSGVGNVNQAEDIGAGGTVAISATCNVDPTLTTSLVNTATLSYGNDPSTANNTATDTDTVVPRANLSISNSDGVTSRNAGASTTYSIVVTNPAPVAVSNVGVSDAFPASLTGCAWTCSASGSGTCQSASGSGDIATTTNSIAGGNGTLTFSATCTVDPATTSTVTNTATLTYANDPVNSNDSAGDTDTIVPLADLSLTNSDGVSSINAGANTTYSIVVTNPAAAAVSAVAVSDTFPAGLSACTWTCSASSGGTCQSANGSGNIATTTNAIAANGGTLSFSATCTLSASATGSLANTAGATYANDSSAANNSATDTDTINARADLSIGNSDGASTILPGANATYTITVTNPATVAVSKVSVNDAFPVTLSGCTWTCNVSGSGTCEAGSGNGNIATTTNAIAGSGGTLTFSATCTLSAGASGSLTNTASVAYGNDVNAANNTATDTDTIQSASDASISNSDGVGSIKAGSNTTYTIVATNPGTLAITGVGVSDTFPASLTNCAWTCGASAGGSCQSASGNGAIATSSNSLAANGGTLTFSATCTVAAATITDVTNTASLSYANDPDSSNNSASDTDTIVPQADLALSNSDGVASLHPGNNTTYSIVVTNPTAAVVSAVSVSDTFPAKLSGCTWTCSASAGGSCEAAGGNGDVATTANSIAASGGTLNFSATCTVSADATGTLVNTASTAYANDPAAANNSQTDTDTLGVQADVAVTISDAVAFAKIGAVLDYTIEVTNPSGPSTAVVSVGDTLPAQLGNGTWVCTGSGNATCGNGSGNVLADTATIPVGGKAAYTYSATLQAAPAGDLLTNTATANLTAGSDPVPGNNSASDSDTVVIFVSGFENPAQLTVSVNAAGARAFGAGLAIDAGLLARLGSIPVTVVSGRSADGKQLFTLDLARFADEIAMRTVTTDAFGNAAISRWTTIDLKQRLLQFDWQSSSAAANDGYVSVSAGGSSVLQDRRDLQDRLTQLLITTEHGVPWAVVIER